jgi:hypothetical protein
MDTLQPRRSSEHTANSGRFFSAFLFCLVLGAAAAAPGSATPDEQATTPDAQATTPDEQATTPDGQATPAGQATTPDQPAAPNEQTLEDYAAECDKAVGVTVPDFDCDAGTDVPGQGNVFSGPDHPTATCDEPNRLRGKCDPGSRFQVLVRSDSAYIVAHCRKEGGDPGMYGDIAVIQHSRTNGATCFYQALGDENHGDMPGGSSAPGMSGQLPVKAPSNGQAGFQWKSPSETAAIGCGKCHDNGAIVRSPYLVGVTGANELPDTSGEPYSFVGEAFKDWKAYTVDVGNECTSCHRLGVSNIGAAKEKGTALDFAMRATADSEVGKNATSPASPIWMLPDPPQVIFDKDHEDEAKAIHDCAKNYDPSNPTHLPDRDDCRITLFAHDYVPGP